MADDNEEPITGEPRHVLDRELDMALAKYAAVEPRAGLNERILANLTAKRAQAAVHGWWYWPRVAVLVAMVAIVVAASLMWRSSKSVRGVVAHHPSNWVQEVPRPQTGSGTGGERVRQQASASPKKRRGSSIRDYGPGFPVVAGAEPRLEQFPSPRPLSDQEKTLANYVAMYPAHANLIARARAEALRRDAAEELEAAKRQ